MGHLATKKSYEKLRERLDRYPVGAPGSTTIYEILKAAYTPEEADLGARMPLKLSSLRAVARAVRIPEAELEPRLEAMARKGLVLDLGEGPKRRYMLAPTVVGFFEFTMMRARGDIDQKRLAELYHRYVVEEPDFTGQFRGEGATTPFRTLLHEQAMPEDYTEVLDYERASHLIREAGRWAITLCHCRHTAHHRGSDCARFRLESCLTIGPVVDYFVRRDLAREIGRDEAAALLDESRDKGMVHIADNVQRQPTFICNCCGCCCEVLQGFRNFSFFTNSFSSNFEARVEAGACTGCGKCAKACPVDALRMTEAPRSVAGKRVQRLAAVEQDICLGCGVCALSCESRAIAMAPRPRRRITPEGTYARILTMAIEQGKLHELIVDKTGGMTAHAAGALLGAILRLPPARQLLAREAVKSRFVDYLLAKRIS